MGRIRLFEQLDIIVQEIISLLELQCPKITKSSYALQRRSLLRQGLVDYRGIYVPLRSIDYRTLFDHYEESFVDIFLNFYRNIFKNKENLFTEFSFRTLLEMGFYRGPIMFSVSLTKKEINKFKLLCMLADYGFLSYDHPKNLPHFQRLYNDHQDLLEDREKDIFMRLSDCVKKSDLDGFNSAVKKARKKIQDYQEKLKKKIQIARVIDGEMKIKALDSSFSHLLHGNILFIESIFSKRRTPEQHLLRAYSILLFSGLNVVSCITEYLDDEEIKTKTEKLIGNYKKLSPQINNYWRKLDKGRKVPNYL